MSKIPTDGEDVAESTFGCVGCLVLVVISMACLVAIKYLWRLLWM